ncbi:MAG: c-type cytochrome [Deltaproteobacteria bacterium]|nr:c-type cytochrome [Deltaproteobacteria bacterium]
MNNASRVGHRTICLLAALLANVVSIAAVAAATRDEQAQRLLTLLSAVGEEYREGVRDGAVVRPIEFDESRSFLADASDLFNAVGAGGESKERVQAQFLAIAKAIDDHNDTERVAEALASLRQQVISLTGVSEEIYPPVAPSAARGSQRFGEYCSSCHGERGNGKGPDATALNPPPANFTDPQFMRGETPYDFVHVISLGKRGTAMPAWDDVLSLQDRWDVISYLWTLRHAPAQLAEGQGIFLAQCASCHGPNGNGQGTFNEVLVSKASDLTQTQSIAKRSDSELFKITSDGVAGTPMPSFARTLSDDERWKAVAYLRALSLGGLPPTDVNETSGGAANPQRSRGMLRLLSRSYSQAFAGGTLTDKLQYDEAVAIAANLVRTTAALADRVAVTHADSAAAIRRTAQDIHRQIDDRVDPAAVSKSVAGLDAIMAALPAEPATKDAGTATSPAVDAALNKSWKLVEEALAAYGRGDGNATALAADAYFEFEPIETQLGAVQPTLKTNIEERFLLLRQTLRSQGKNADLEQVATLIRTDFDAVRATLQPQASSYGLFLQSGGIILREGFEVVLVIGALLAYVSKAGGSTMRRAVHIGTLLGIVASLATGLLMGELLHAYPGSSEILEGFTMLLAAGVLFWVSYWLISKTEADKWQRYIRGKVQQAVTRRSTAALAGAAFLAVYREGFETVLFYQALFGSAPHATAVLTSGVIAGSAALFVVSILFRYFQVQIPLQQFFFVTGTFLGVYPSLQSLAAQAVFGCLLLYATFVAVRRRTATAAATAPNELVAELAQLRTTLDQLRQELARSNAAPSLSPIAALSTRAEDLLQNLQHDLQLDSPTSRRQRH